MRETEILRLSTSGDKTKSKTISIIVPPRQDKPSFALCRWTVDKRGKRRLAKAITLTENELDALSELYWRKEVAKHKLMMEDSFFLDSIKASEGVNPPDV